MENETKSAWEKQNHWDHNDTKKYRNKKRNHPYVSENEEVVSVWEWFGLSLVLVLLSIIPVIGPFIGLIMIIIISVSKDINKNIQNFFRSILIWYLISIIIMFTVGISAFIQLII